MQSSPLLTSLNGLTPMFRGVTLMRHELQLLGSENADAARAVPPEIVIGSRVILNQDGLGISSGARGGVFLSLCARLACA